jgi:hypothetical protein
MKLSKFATMRGMTFAYDRTNQPLIDSVLNGSQGDEIRESLKLKRIQFDTAPQLSSDLESVCSLLDCSKREFLEMAVRDAIEKAQALFMDAFKDVSGQDFMDLYGEQMTQAEVDAIPQSWES